MNSILSVQDLCLWYGSHQALTNINIDGNLFSFVSNDVGKEAIK